MKRIFLVIVVLLCVMPTSFAQSGYREIQMNDIKVNREGESMVITFRAKVDKKAVKRSYHSVFAPVITDGKNSWSLPAIIVQGKRAKLRSGESFEEAVYTSNGKSFLYRAELPYQSWMDRANLVMEGINVGCCSVNELPGRVLISGLLPVQSQSQYQYVAETPRVVEQVVVEAGNLSTGDKLAQSFSFVQPVSEYNRMALGEFSYEDRENSVTLYFHQGSSKIVREYANNDQSLVDLMSSIRIIQNSFDTKVSHVVIAGFASPEGSFEFNDRLAWNRAAAMKEYIIRHSGLNPDKIRIYNGSEDWQGLRALVERSNMFEKYEILNIIDNVPIRSPYGYMGRLDILKRLNGGHSYKFMYDYLFPQLRNAAYIKIYYENNFL